MDYKDALKYSMALCSSRECCRSDVAGKLRERDLPEPDITKILATLEKDNFLNETRYAASFARDKLKFNKWGKMKIRYALSGKQIPEEIIVQALEEIDEEYYAGILREEDRGSAGTVVVGHGAPPGDLHGPGEIDGGDPGIQRNEHNLRQPDVIPPGDVHVSLHREVTRLLVVDRESSPAVHHQVVPAIGARQGLAELGVTEHRDGRAHLQPVSVGQIAFEIR